MPGFPFSSLATLLALLVFIGVGMVVGQARTRYGVRAPAVTGHPAFERCYRVQMNTLEQLALLLPALWLCALWVGDGPAAAGGVLWCLGRAVYARAYYADAAKRGPGFALTFLPTLAMLAAVLAAIVRAMV